MGRRSSDIRVKGDDHLFDVVVIGGGSAGVSAAETARRSVGRVCVIEEGKLGGECAWRACVPTKALLTASKMYYRIAHEGDHFGVRAKKLSFDFPAMMKRKDAAVQAITGSGKGLEKFFKSNGISLVRGKAVFEDDHTVRVGSHIIRGKAFIIATGSRDAVPEIGGLEDSEYLTYKDVVEMRTLPASIGIIGAGPVGTEFATFFSQLGVKVALFHRSPHILSKEDEEVALFAEERLKMFGVQVFTNTNPLGVKKERKGIRITYQTGRQPRKSVLVEKLLIATGKLPNIDSLDLPVAGVKISADGRLLTDDRLRTNVKHIFVAGDATSHITLTSTAHHEGSLAGWNAAHVGKNQEMAKIDLNIVPHATFLDPEIAGVGMKMKDAVKMGINVRVLRSPFSLLGRAAIEGRRFGFLKVVVERDTGIILGAHMIGERSGEVIHELALAMKAKMPIEEVQSMLHAYPTYSEIIPALQEV